MPKRMQKLFIMQVEMKRFGIIAATLIAGLSLAGCGEKQEGPSRQAASQESTPVEKAQAEIKHVLEKNELLLNSFFIILKFFRFII